MLLKHLSQLGIEWTGVVDHYMNEKYVKEEAKKKPLGWWIF